MNGVIEQRLELLSKERVHRVGIGGTFVLDETASEGKASVTVRLPGQMDGIVFKLSQRTEMQILRSAKNADGSFLCKIDDKNWIGYVVEIKHSPKTKLIEGAQEQLRAGLQRLFMVAAFLGIHVNEWRTVLVRGPQRAPEQLASDPARLLRSTEVEFERVIAVPELGVAAPFEIIDGRIDAAVAALTAELAVDEISTH